MFANAWLNASSHKTLETATSPADSLEDPMDSTPIISGSAVLTARRGAFYSNEFAQCNICFAFFIPSRQPYQDSQAAPHPFHNGSNPERYGWLGSCQHGFCHQCVHSYLRERLKGSTHVGLSLEEIEEFEQDQVVWPINCPLCWRLFQRYEAKAILGLDNMELWHFQELAKDTNTVTSISIVSFLPLGAERWASTFQFRCPNSKCNILLALDSDEELPLVSVCPYCFVEVCGICRTADHPGITCGESEDLLSYQEALETRGRSPIVGPADFVPPPHAVPAAPLPTRPKAKLLQWVISNEESRFDELRSGLTEPQSESSTAMTGLGMEVGIDWKVLEQPSKLADTIDEHGTSLEPSNEARSWKRKHPKGIIGEEKKAWKGKLKAEPPHSDSRTTGESSKGSPEEPMVSSQDISLSEVSVFADQTSHLRIGVPTGGPAGNEETSCNSTLCCESVDTLQETLQTAEEVQVEKTLQEVRMEKKLQEWLKRIGAPYQSKKADDSGEQIVDHIETEGQHGLRTGSTEQSQPASEYSWSSVPIPDTWKTEGILVLPAEFDKLTPIVRYFPKTPESQQVFSVLSETNANAAWTALGTFSEPPRFCSTARRSTSATYSEDSLVIIRDPQRIPSSPTHSIDEEEWVFCPDGSSL